MDRSDWEAFAADRIGQLSAMAEAAHFDWKAKIPEAFSGSQGFVIATLATQLGISVVDAFDTRRKLQSPQPQTPQVQVPPIPQGKTN